MEGMVAKEMRQIQDTYSKVEGSAISLVSWTTGLVIKLLEITHGQWLYRCVQVHDRVRGTQVTTRKEDLQREIEKQWEEGWGELLEEDQYLAEVNLEDLEQSSGEKQEYWQLAIRAAREASILQGGQTNQRVGEGRIVRDR